MKNRHTHTVLRCGRHNRGNLGHGGFHGNCSQREENTNTLTYTHICTYWPPYSHRWTHNASLQPQHAMHLHVPSQAASTPGVQSVGRSIKMIHFITFHTLLHKHGCDCRAWEWKHAVRWFIDPEPRPTVRSFVTDRWDLLRFFVKWCRAEFHGEDTWDERN